MPHSREALGQLPRFSAYDPGATGEGSLDPIGLAAIADRLAEHLAPGIRARMGNPRFALLATVGAFANESLIDNVSRDGKTTPDVAFEWLVLEALAYRGGRDALKGVPGSQKASSAKASGRRLGPGNYLVAPRIFGFNGVYRPFCQDSAILRPEGTCGPAADALLEAWQADQRLDGFVSGQPGSLGHKLRLDIERETAKALELGHAAASTQGALYATLAVALAPNSAGVRERRELRKSIAQSQHEVRNDVVRLIQESPGALEASEDEVCMAIRPVAAPETASVLDAIAAYESCATLIDHAFRDILSTATAQGGTFTTKQAADFAAISEAARQAPDLAARALDALARLDETLAHDAQAPIGSFTSLDGGAAFAEELIERHRVTQEAKGKRMWIDPVNGAWIVRPPYRKQETRLSTEGWLHPMRIHTLISFLEWTR